MCSSRSSCWLLQSTLWRGCGGFQSYLQSTLPALEILSVCHSGIADQWAAAGGGGGDRTIGSSSGNARWPVPADRRRKGCRAAALAALAAGEPLSKQQRRHCPFADGLIFFATSRRCCTGCTRCRCCPRDRSDAYVVRVQACILGNARIADWHCACVMHGIVAQTQQGRGQGPNIALALFPSFMAPHRTRKFSGVFSECCLQLLTPPIPFHAGGAEVRGQSGTNHGACADAGAVLSGGHRHR